MKTTIITDSASDLGGEGRGIIVIPLTVLLGEREGADGEITPDDIYAYFAETGRTPKTAAVGPERFEKVFAEVTAGGGEAVYISIASTMSACYGNARLAAENYPGVRVVDSGWLSGGIALLALYAEELAGRGLGADEIVARVEARKSAVRLSLIVDTMTFLHRGGRCGSLAAFVAGVLKIRPSIVMTDGKLTVGRKYIGPARRALTKYAADALAAADNIDPAYFYLVHTSPKREILDETEALIRSARPDANIIERVAGATITSHTGRGGIALIYFNDGGNHHTDE